MVSRVMTMVMTGMLFFVEAIIVAVPVFGDFHLKLGVPIQFSMGEPVGQMGERRIQAGAKHGKRDHHGQAGPLDLICLQHHHLEKPICNAMTKENVCAGRCARASNPDLWWFVTS